MFEVEMKFRVQNIVEFITILAQKYSAHFDPEVIETDLFFQHPVRDFAKTDECLRLRCRHNELMITYKGAKIDSLTKTREEIELPLYGKNKEHNCNIIQNSERNGNRSETESGNISDSLLSKDPEFEKRLSEWTILLNRLGFYEKAVVRKRRRYGQLIYENCPVIVTLDCLDKIGNFTEFELSVDSEEKIDRARALLLRLAASLGLGQSIRVSYLELCLAADH